MKTALIVKPRFPTGPSTVLDMPLHGPLNVSQTLVQDRSQNSNRGTIGSAITFAYPGLTFDDTANAKITPATANVGNPRTFSCWIKPDNIADSDVLFNLENVADNIVVASGTLGELNLTNNITAYVDGVASTTVVASIWQMCTIILDGAESASNLLIGSATTVKYDGVMADILISNDEFSAAEVLSLFSITKHLHGV